ALDSESVWVTLAALDRAGKLGQTEPSPGGSGRCSWPLAHPVGAANTVRRVTWFFAARCRLAGWRDGCDLRAVTRAVGAWERAESSEGKLPRVLMILRIWRLSASIVLVV